MIARVADHCFWLGRYLERAESTARVLHVNGSIALDAELSPREAWHPVVIVAGQEQDFEARLSYTLDYGQVEVFAGYRYSAMEMDTVESGLASSADMVLEGYQLGFRFTF